MKNKNKGLLIVLAILMTVALSIGGLISCEEEKVTLSSIEIAIEPETNYLRGEALKLEDGVIALLYSDDSFKEIPMLDEDGDYTAGVKVTGYDNDILGSQEITVSYGGKTTTFNVFVSEAPISGIAVTTAPTVTDYFVGEKTPSLAGGIIRISYQTGATSQVDMTANGVVAGELASEEGTGTVEVSYTIGSQTFDTSYAITMHMADTLEIITEPKAHYSSNDDGFVAGGTVRATKGSIVRTVPIVADMIENFTLVPTRLFDTETNETIFESEKTARVRLGGETADFSYTLTHNELGLVRYAHYFATYYGTLSYDEGIPAVINQYFPKNGSERRSIAIYCMEALELYNTLGGQLRVKAEALIKPIILLSADWVEYVFASDRTYFANFFQSYDGDQFAALYPQGQYTNPTDPAEQPRPIIELYAPHYAKMMEYYDWVREYLDPHFSLRLSETKTVNSVIDPIISLMDGKSDLFEQSQKDIDSALAAFKTFGSDPTQLPNLAQLPNLTDADYINAYEVLLSNLTQTSVYILRYLHDINYGGINAGLDLQAGQFIIDEKDAFVYRLYESFYNNEDYESSEPLVKISIFPNNLIATLYDNLNNALSFQYTVDRELAGKDPLTLPGRYIDSYYCDYYVRIADELLEMIKSIGDPMILSFLYNSHVQYTLENDPITMYDFYYSAKHAAVYSQINIFGTSATDPAFDSFIKNYYVVLTARSAAITKLETIKQEKEKYSEVEYQVLIKNAQEEIDAFGVQIEEVMFDFFKLDYRNMLSFIVGSDLVQWNAFKKGNIEVDATRFSFFEGSDFTYSLFISMIKSHFISGEVTTDGKTEIAPVSKANLTLDQQRVFKYIFRSLEEYLWLMYSADDSNEYPFVATMFNAIRHYEALETTEKAAFNGWGMTPIYNRLLEVYGKYKNGWNYTIDEATRAKLEQLDEILNDCGEYIITVASDKYPESWFYSGYLAAERLWQEILDSADSNLHFYLKNNPTAYKDIMSYDGKLNELNTHFNKRIKTMNLLLFRIYDVELEMRNTVKNIMADYYDSFVAFKNGSGYDNNKLNTLYQQYISLNELDRLYFTFIDAFGGMSFQGMLYDYFSTFTNNADAQTLARNILVAEVFYAYELIGLDPTKVGYPETFASQMEIVIASMDSMSEKAKAEFKKIMLEDGQSNGAIYQSYLRLLSAYNAL